MPNAFIPPAEAAPAPTLDEVRYRLLRDIEMLRFPRPAWAEFEDFELAVERAVEARVRAEVEGEREAAASKLMEVAGYATLRTGRVSVRAQQLIREAIEGMRAALRATEWVLLEGVKYLAPFLCMCCGREVEARQWAFGMACGLCDTGICQTWHDHHRPEHAHAEPVWRPHAVGDSRTDKVARFMDYANHEFRVAAAAPTTEEAD